MFVNTPPVMLHANDRELRAAIVPAKVMNLDMVISTPFLFPRMT
jgi:hypothetical protein